MKIIATLLMASATLLAPVALPAAAVAATRVALACPADAPEGWKRPGGYCEQRNTLDTIGTEKGNGVSCRMDADIGDMAPLQRGGKVLLLAMPYNPCCDTSMSVLPSDLPDGLLMRSDAIDAASLCPN